MKTHLVLFPLVALALAIQGCRPLRTRDCPPRLEAVRTPRKQPALFQFLRNAGYGPIHILVIAESSGGGGPGFSLAIFPDGSATVRSWQWLLGTGFYQGSLKREDFASLQTLVMDFEQATPEPWTYWQCGHAGGLTLNTPELFYEACLVNGKSPLLQFQRAAEEAVRNGSWQPCLSP